MNLKGIIKSIFFWVIFVSMLIHSNFGRAYAAEFEIEDIITAIKQDIQSVMMNGSGSPNFEIGYSPQSSFGLVAPINKIKSSLGKAYNSPPSSKLDTFKISLQFAIEKGKDGGFSFNIIDVNNLKARNIAIHYVTISMKIDD